MSLTPEERNLADANENRGHRLTTEQIETNKEIARSQFSEAKGPTKVTCTCGRSIPIRFAYKCLYCDIFRCMTCAEAHFGKSRKDYFAERHPAPASPSPVQAPAAGPDTSQHDFAKATCEHGNAHSCLQCAQAHIAELEAINNALRATLAGAPSAGRPEDISPDWFTSAAVFVNMLRLWTPEQCKEFYAMLSRRPDFNEGAGRPMTWTREAEAELAKLKAIDTADIVDPYRQGFVVGKLAGLEMLMPPEPETSEAKSGERSDPAPKEIKLDSNGWPLCVCGHSSDQHCCGTNECNVSGHCDWFRCSRCLKPQCICPAPIREAKADPGQEVCHADRDGDCVWPGCPQLRDGEPKATGRHCPLDTDAEDDDTPAQGKEGAA